MNELNIRTRDVRSMRRQALRGIKSGLYSLALVSDGRRYRLGAKTTGNSVIVFSGKFDKLPHAEAVAHTRFPGKSIVRVSVPKVRKTVAAA
jgi:hypothetical protein